MIGIQQRPPPYRRPIMPPCGTERQLGRSRPDQPAGTNHPNPFYADHHRLPFHRCTMRRSFYNQREGSNSDADLPLQGSSLQAFQHPFAMVLFGEGGSRGYSRSFFPRNHILRARWCGPSIQASGLRSAAVGFLCHQCPVSSWPVWRGRNNSSR